jgi:predicted Zn-dependent peptidase
MAVDRSRLPGLGPEPAFTFPEIRRRMLPNGIRVLTAEHREVPIVSALALVPSGASADPPERPGLAAITGDLLDDGCGDLDALALHDAVARIGGQIETEVGADATLVGMTALERFAPRALALLADMVIRPRLELHEFTRVRDLRINRLMQLREVPPAIAERTFTRLLYGPHPYGHQAIGSEESLKAMTVEEVRGFHGGAYQPSQVTMIAVGDASHDQLGDLVEQAFGGWNGSARAATGRDWPSPPLANGRRFAVVHRAGAAQSELRIGHVSVPRSTPDYHALLVLNLILGGQFVSRINMKLREEKGYTYGARTSFELRRGPGPFLLQASVQSEPTADAVHDALHEIAAIRRDRPVTQQELELGRAGLTRGYPRNFETSDQMGRAAAQLALYELPDDYFTRFVPKVLALSADDITAAAARHLHPDRLLTVVVGDRDKFGDGLAEIAGNELIDAAAS